MLELLINIITFSIMPLTGFFVVKELVDSNQCIHNGRNILIVTCLILINSLVYNIEYEALITLLNFSTVIIGNKYIFKISVFESFLLTTILMIFVFISDMVVYVLFSFIFGAEALRSLGLIMILSNVLVGIFAISLSKIKYLKKIINKLLLKLERSTKIQSISLSILWITVISMLCYSIFTSNQGSFGFWLSLIIEIVFTVFIITFFREKDKYIVLNEKFDDLYDYIQTIEESLDNEELNTHEYKNQLTVIKNMTKDKKVIKYIDSLGINKVAELGWNASLKKLPKGGFKGLIYYKCAQAKQKGLNLTVDINSDVKDYFLKMSLENLKTLSRMVGIYLDNAIESSVDTENKIISIEIYKSRNNVNIVISNSFVGKINFNQINKKGYSSKGKNRGKGLYLVTKILKGTDMFEVSSSIINDYFVQRIVLK